MSSPRSRSQHGVNRRSKHAGLLRIPKSFCKRHFCKGKRTERPGRRRLWCCCALPETCFFGQDCWCSASKTCWKASTKSGNQEKLCFVLILARTKLRASSMWGSLSLRLTRAIFDQPQRGQTKIPPGTTSGTNLC